ncbi:MAG: hypothetical protein RQ756_04755 [Flavobacteriaceae bacterium]|nr:hypothetical protein [Flavobacteriaceae bacterium]
MKTTLKKLRLALVALIVPMFGFAAGNPHYSNSIIFVEGGIEFAVFPDGQFDFTVLNNNAHLSLNYFNENVAFSFNTGYTLDAYVQYDSYGAPIQIMDVPVFYDYYGRVNQVGNINIAYINGRLHRVGGMYVYYSPGGYFNRFSGYISPYYRSYVYRPYHSYYRIPAANYCIVYNRPYRRYYSPVRYSYAHHRNHYHRPGYNAGRRIDYARPGQQLRSNRNSIATGRAVQTQRRSGDMNRTAQRSNNTTRAARSSSVQNNRSNNTSNNTARLSNTNNRNRSVANTRTRASKPQGSNPSATRTPASSQSNRSYRSAAKPRTQNSVSSNTRTTTSSSTRSSKNTSVRGRGI